MKWLVTYPEDGPSVPRYLNFVRLCGAEPVLLSERWEAPSELEPFDALLLSGGGDVDPARYGEAARHPATYDVVPKRDDMEARLIDAFLERRRPIFGICRGIQMLNVYFGGGLLQHVPDICAEETECHQQNEGYDATHALNVDSLTRLGRALADLRETNSAHHQAINPRRLGAGLRIVALSGAGIIEAVESDDPALRISAVQWHPERLPPDHPAAFRLAAHWRALSAGETPP
jgi:gamma-glutamyl-gamma-aminobutyrate hydrolase PuuD